MLSAWLAPACLAGQGRHLGSSQALTRPTLGGAQRCAKRCKPPARAGARTPRVQVAAGAGLNPEQDIALAQQALMRGDLKHAAFHVGGALATNPENPDWLALLDQIITQAGNKSPELPPPTKGGLHCTPPRPALNPPRP